MKETLISIQAQRDVLNVIYQALDGLGIVDDRTLQDMEVGVMTYDCCILTIKMMEGS